MPLDVPPGDDAAVLPDGTVLTTDVLVEGVHWDHRLSPEDVGYKAVAVNASDIAACGARPTWMLLGLAVRGDDAWSRRFADGVAEAAEAYDIDLIGGDTTSVPEGGPRVISVTLAGMTTSGGPMRRDRGRAGDHLVVTGIPGLAGAGYLAEDPHADALAALRRPASRVGFALDVALYVHTAMDLSDGLRSDLPRLCRASGVGAVLDPTALPDHPALHTTHLPPRTLALAAGDDYELLLAVPADALDHVLRAGHRCEVPVTVIGQLIEGDGIHLTDGDWPEAPWAHFRGRST